MYHFLLILLAAGALIAPALAQNSMRESAAPSHAKSATATPLNIHAEESAGY